MVHPVVELLQANGTSLLIVVHRRLQIGREGADVILSDPLVSRQHATIEPVGDTVSVSDLGSSNGTHLNGVPVAAPTPIAPGDAVSIGDTTLRLAAFTVAPPEPPPETDVDEGSHATVFRGSEAGPPTGPVTRPVTRDTDVRATSIDMVAQEVRDDRDVKHEVSRLESKTGGTLTFAFSDIESSTEQAERLGDDRWFKALTAHNTIIEGLVGDYGGKVIKSVGDGFMLTFPGATQAGRCAIAIQRAMAEHAITDPDLGVRVRMGLHTGEAIEADGDLFGTHVNMAARVANLARGRQIMVSSLTRAIAQSAGDLEFGPEHGVTLKGLTGTHNVCELIWEPPESE